MRHLNGFIFFPVTILVSIPCLGCSSLLRPIGAGGASVTEVPGFPGCDGGTAGAPPPITDESMCFMKEENKASTD